MYRPEPIYLGRIFILFAFFLVSTVSLGAETAAQDSTRIAGTTLTPGATAEIETGTSELPGSAWGSATHNSESQSAASGGDEKKRVPKAPPKESPKENKAVAEEDDDDDSCVESCLGGFLVGLFTSSDDDEEEHYVPQTALRDTFPEGTYGTVARQTEFEPEPEPERVVTPNDFSLVLDLSWWKSGPSDVREEYKDGGFRFGVNGYFIMAENFEIGIGAGYSHARGYPPYEYETSTTLESPQKTRLNIFDTGIRAGMIHTFSPKGPFLRWGLGPRLFWVKETADLKVYSLPDMDPLDDRTESLEKWRLGGDLVISMLWDTNSSVLVGVSTRLFVIPWNSSYEKSLTLDYIGKKPLVGLSIGVAVHFNGF